MWFEADDPFLALRPFVDSPTNYYQAHYHEIIGSIVFYQILNLASPLISKWLFHKHYEILSPRSKLNFDIHVVSMIQCLISIVAIIPLVGDPYLNESPTLHYTPYAAFVSSITVGYFVWDLWVCTRHFSMFGVGFLAHAVASLWVFSCTLYPFSLGWVASFLAFELSTPFVNVNWFINKLPAGAVPSWLVVANGLLLIISFFLVRIVWGFYAIYLAAFDFWTLRDQIPRFIAISIVGLNFMLDVLNLYWFQKMIQIAVKKANGKSKKTE